MDKINRPRGRDKKITSGTANVYKRGEGINADGKPFGKQDGYAGRKPKNTKSTKAAESSKSLSSDLITGLAPVVGELITNSLSGKKSKKSNLKTILIIAVILIVGYFVIQAIIPKEDVPAIQTQNAGEVTAGQSSPLNSAVSGSANPKRTVIKGNGEDIYTIMIFMCGSDLESRYGMATADLNEILKSRISDKVNIIVETGGAESWKTKAISNTTNQRYECTNDGLVLLEDDIGQRSMTDPATLTDFIKYCKTNYSANRYALIFWDHGGGSINGFGYDQKFPNTSMTLDKIDTALKNAGCEFDFIGFDACLMATLENALMLSRYSDYMIASEETEPGIGWYYTDWISELSNNTSTRTVDIGKSIIDDFVDKCAKVTPRDATTLSIVDLAELSGTVPRAFSAFADSTKELIDSKKYETVSNARGAAREFGQMVDIDQIDLVHFAQNLNTDEADEMINVLKRSIKYNRTSSSVTNANGISIYFPYDRLSGLSTMLSTYDKIGMDARYSDCIKSFANLEAGGQIVTSGSSSPLDSLLGNSGNGTDTGSDLISGLLSSFIDSGDFSSILGKSSPGKEWIDTGRMMDSVGYYEQHYIDSANIKLIKKNGSLVLKLSEAEWDLVQSINLNVFFDDGKGFIDHGLDNVFEFDKDNDLKIDYDGTWLTINGHIVSYYYLLSDENADEYTITGRVPALLNGQLVDIILVFDDKNPDGAVAGARIVYGTETETAAKGLIEIKDGDRIDFICDYYTYGGDFEDSYMLGDPLTVNGELKVRNMSIGDAKCKVTYLLTDIYNNTYWTPAVDYPTK